MAVALIGDLAERILAQTILQKFQREYDREYPGSQHEVENIIKSVLDDPTVQPQEMMRVILAEMFENAMQRENV